MNNPGEQRGLGKFERAGFIWGIEQLVEEGWFEAQNAHWNRYERQAREA